MTRLTNKIAVVTGGSRGLGKGVVKALAAEGAEVWAVARNETALAALEKEIPGVKTLSADVSDADAASHVFEAVKPDILVLCAGAKPHMAPVHEQSWEQFQTNWNTDVKSAFHFGKAAMSAPMAQGSQVAIISSGAAISGSFLSGGYAGAKRMQWFLAGYMQKESDALDLGIRYTAVLPKQMIGSTDLGDHASAGYAARLGISQEKFLERFNPPLTPDDFGIRVVSVLLDGAYKEGIGFGITGAGIETLN